MEPVHAPLRPAAIGARLQPEEALDLVPAADDERDRDREQHEERDVEAVPRELPLLLPTDQRLATRAVVAVPQVDGGIGRELVGLLQRPGSGLGHARSVVVRPPRTGS